ncbi:uncharacterized protein DSM5745_09658 [Aspergillus mulundensis]|uniref:Cytochrome P450 n=1 Tax=Aspergillus mulundensis TaxID=1810919 RepID=A0A3D8QVX8_9EURO|nr:hypothetical protein DSM5745_09658 [Aspergillus mulundensis]RDW65919.1 hypothetical protein DSM5745_09658 [Aspergillus mulundensis]
MSTRAPLRLVAPLRQNPSLTRPQIHAAALGLRARSNLSRPATASFSTSQTPLNNASAPKDGQQKEKEPRYWKYDISFRTQMEKIVLIAFLAAVGSTAWYKELRGWLGGVEDDVDKEQLKAMQQSSVPFATGARTCIGKNISLLEMARLIPVPVRDYDFEIQVQRPGEWGMKDRWFVKPTDFWVGVERRESV